MVPVPADESPRLYLYIMKNMFRHFIFPAIASLSFLMADAQKMNRSDKKLKKELSASVSYLADDKLQGRRTGTEGERLAYEFIIQKFKKAGLSATSNGYLQPFEFTDGRDVTPNSRFAVADITYKLHEDYFPLAWSGSANNLSFVSNLDASAAWLNLAPTLEQNSNNPHFDLKEHILAAAKTAEKEGKKAMFLYNSSSTDDQLRFDGSDKSSRLSIPVIYLKKQVPAETPLSLTIDLADKKRKGHNVVGMIDNGAAHTIVIGAHYDHLGFGEDRNSLYAGKDPQIHNGADDNASGTAALIALGKKLKKSGLKKYNYIFVAFSGEELGLYGSKYFTEHSPVDMKQVNFMINMDMIGRLNDTARSLTVGGVGTSPAWKEVISTNHDYFTLKVDSSGSGPSDHTSFYRKDIPVLFFFTGTHSDYHKPSDDADKINFNGQIRIVKYIYSIIEWANTREKLAFTKTKEPNMGRSSFKVSMGIMPDYTFSGPGVLVDGVSEGRPAQKAGVLAKDIILQIGEHSTSDVQEYMKALGKFNKGEAVKVKLKRGEQVLTLDLVF